MNGLVELATATLEAKYRHPVHTVAAALRTESGNVITAVNIDHFLGFVCAETAALAIAMNSEEHTFSEIVAVRKNDDGAIEVIDMCGKCRQIYFDYAPGITVLTSDGPKRIEELLPLPFTRQREKINQSFSR